ncbi:MAG: apolipoprotein N-acyltransferase [Rhizobiaceae bacterium]|nr:apolipoprotein N-acyltransferase [Rhizobiaceae bacterium]
MERLAGRIILLWGWQRAAAAFAAGALLVLAQAPYDFFAVGFVSFPVLVWLLDGVTAPASGGLLRRVSPPFMVGWWFGLGYFLAGLWWIGNALLVEADSFAWALPFAVVGVPAVLAVFYGVATVLARLLWGRGLASIFAIAFGFGLAEWLRETVLTGFPWNAVGYAAMPMPILMQSASVVGLTGMNVLAVFVFAAPALLGREGVRRTGILLAALLCLLHVGFGYWRLSQPEVESSKSLSVRIVQPSVAMDAKWDRAEEDRIFSELMDMTAAPPAAGQPKPQLIIWPETSVPFLFTERPDALAAIGALLTDGQMLLAGAVRAEGAGADAVYYNSIVAIDAGGEIADAFDKVHLVPFGEYLPFAPILERLGLTQLVAGPMNFEPGAHRRPIVVPGGLRAVPFICYEIIFPAEVAVDVAAGDIIVNVTNDAWFGNSPGPYQHFRQAQIRAVETGVPVMRAANSGISGGVDARGRIIDAFALNVRSQLDFRVSVGEAAQTLRIPYQTVGLAIVGLFGFVALAGALLRRALRN